MKITSDAFQHETNIPQKYTCDGINVNPPLRITDVPPQTKSLVLIMDDPDVPKYIRQDSTWDHWIIFNIPPDTTFIAEGNAPEGVYGLGTGNNTKYYGPCPPQGEHRYFFKLYALDVLLALPEKSNKQQIEQAMQGHILAQAELMGIYGRS